MSTSTLILVHSEDQSPTEREEARVEHLKKYPELVFHADVQTKARNEDFAWLPPTYLRSKLPTKRRFKALECRPDIRARITANLTGMTPEAAADFTIDEQIMIIDRHIDFGHVLADEFEKAFDPHETVAYFDPCESWGLLVDSFPWDSAGPKEKDLLCFVLNRGLEKQDEEDDPVMKPVDILYGIDSDAWMHHMPKEILAQIREDRLERESGGKRYTADDELNFITIEGLVNTLPCDVLRPFFEEMKELFGNTDTAERITREVAPPPLNASATPAPADTDPPPDAEEHEKRNAPTLRPARPSDPNGSNGDLGKTDTGPPEEGFSDDDVASEDDLLQLVADSETLSGAIEEQGIRFSGLSDLPLAVLRPLKAMIVDGEWPSTDERVSAMRATLEKAGQLVSDKTDHSELESRFTIWIGESNPDVMTKLLAHLGKSERAQAHDDTPDVSVG